MTDYDAIKRELVELSEKRGYTLHLGQPQEDDSPEYALKGTDDQGVSPNSIYKPQLRGVKRFRVNVTVVQPKVKQAMLVTKYHYPVRYRRVHENAIWVRQGRSLPNAGDVLHSLLFDANSGSDTFQDFCGNCGYDTDSRKAFVIYEACQQAFTAMRAMFGDDLDAAMELANQL